MNVSERLHRIFNPDSVAVIGASSNPRKPGFLCTTSLVNDGFRGAVYPVNPSLTELSGWKAYPSVLDIPGQPDLAISVVPAEQALAVTEECIQKGVKGIIHVSAGFNEIGSETGAHLQSALRAVANKADITIVGPNTMGLLNTKANLNATFSPGLSLVKSGNVSVVSQSGGMSVYLVNALAGNNIGIGKVIGLGNRCNLDFDDMVTYLAGDEETGVLVLYIEGMDNPKKLMQAARKAAAYKPVVVMKGGRSEESGKSTASHTGALAGNYELYKAAFAQSGIITVESLTELADVTKALALQPPANGNRMAVLSLQAGPGIIAADKLYEYGMKLAVFDEDTRQRLRKNISPLLSIENPVDMAWTGSNFDASQEILNAVIDDKGIDGILVAFISFELSRELPKAIVEIARGKTTKPVVVCAGSLGRSENTVNDLEDAGIPVFPFPDRACTGLRGLMAYGETIDRNRQE